VLVFVISVVLCCVCDRRLAWNKQDPNYLATIMVDSAKTMVLDIRVPSVPVSSSTAAVVHATLILLLTGTLGTRMSSTLELFRTHIYSEATVIVRALALQVVFVRYNAVLMHHRTSRTSPLESVANCCTTTRYPACIMKMPCSASLYVH
jgi:hypothetical protein